MPIASLKSAQIFYLDQPATENTGLAPGDLPVLLVHGFSSSIADNWLNTNWVKFLNQNGWRVIALDNRGHGKSQKFYSQEDYSLPLMANDAIELLDHLEIPKSHIIGYSMGARIAAAMVLNNGDRTGRVILGGNGYGMIEGTGDWTPVHDGLLAKNPDEITDLRARAFRRFADRTGSDRRALAACVMGIRDRFSEGDFAAITNSVLIAIGEEDDIAGSGEKLAAIMQNARFFSIPGRDHMRASGDKAFKNEAAVFLREEPQL
ncbi:MAG: alpha/beta hydrolase [Rhizobiaceae bacterium]|nr:alpha/beta hydrolase [Rhizobiaceae bacterium]